MPVNTYLVTRLYYITNYTMHILTSNKFTHFERPYQYQSPDQRTTTFVPRMQM